MMYSTHRFAKYGSRGFTLIELLVVIAIIGILASVILASLSSARAKGRDAKRISDLKNIQLALELYYDNNGQRYPATLSALAPTYIPIVPSDPSGGSSAYRYAGIGSATTGCTSYHLGADLENANSPALASDADDPGSAGICTGSAANFNGADSGKCNASDIGVACLDYTP